MVNAYSVFATNGIKFRPSAILKIEDNKGNIIYKNEDSGKRVLRSTICSYINDILSDNQARAPMFGWHSKLFIPGYKVAAKTGSTNGFKDAWTIGYTDSIVTGVWVGNNNHKPTLPEPGVVLAGPIWNEFMSKALKEYPPKNSFPKMSYPRIEKEMVNGHLDPKNYHSILYFINPDNITGPIPSKKDIQYNNWERSVQNWISKNR